MEKAEKLAIYAFLSYFITTKKKQLFHCIILYFVSGMSMSRTAGK